MRKNIEAERGRMGLSKVALSAALNITTKTYNGYVKGKPIPSDILVAMADMFDCSVDYLLGLNPARTA